MGLGTIVRFRMTVRWLFYEMIDDYCEERIGKKKLTDAYTADMFLDQFREEYIWKFSLWKLIS